METKHLRDIGLTLFFTRKVGLNTWDQVGNLDREVELYRRLSKDLRTVSFLTYGGRADAGFRDRLAPIKVLPATWHGRQTFTLLGLMLKHWPSILSSDILKTNQIPGSEIPITLKRLLGKKLIVRCGYLYSFFVKEATNDDEVICRAIELERKAFSAADIGIVTSAWQREIVVSRYGIDPAKIKVVPNYVATDVFRPQPEIEKRFDLVYVGRGGPQKNLDSLLGATNLLKNKGRDLSLLMIGGCCKDPAIRNEALQSGLDITFAGSVPNAGLPQMLHQARIFIQPSLYEGHPKTLLEAMSCGLPCIGSNVSGIKEDIVHGDTGFLCRTDPAAIASAVETVLSDAALRERMGSKARDYILGNYSLDLVYGLELDIMRGLISGE